MAELAPLQLLFVYVGSVAALSALFAFRIVRISRLLQLLAQPAADFLRKAPKAARLLPPQIRLDSDRPVLELLYEAYRKSPKLFAPDAILEFGDSRPLDRLPASFALASASESTGDEAFNQLLDVRHYGQNPDQPPIDALTTQLLRNLFSVLKGKKKLGTGIEHALYDSLVPGGGFAGAKLGGAVGLLASSVLAGAAPVALPLLILSGAWLGSTAGKKLGARMKARELFQAIRKLRKEAALLHRAFLRRFPALLQAVDRDFQERIELAERLRKSRQSFLGRFLLPDVLTVFLALGVERLRVDWRNERRSWRGARRKIRMLPPLVFAQVLRELGDQAVFGDRELEEQLAKYAEALGALESIQKRAAA